MLTQLRVEQEVGKGKEQMEVLMDRDVNATL